MEALEHGEVIDPMRMDSDPMKTERSSQTEHVPEIKEEIE
jgi:hypothetical protein